MQTAKRPLADFGKKKKEKIELNFLPNGVWYGRGRASFCGRKRPPFLGPRKERGRGVKVTFGGRALE